jgi:hypothetical protein
MGLSMQRAHNLVKYVPIVIAIGSIIAGTYLLLAGMSNTTADGEPFSYPVLPPLNFLVWAAPSIVSIIYLFISNEGFAPWLFAAFCCFWAFGAYQTYAAKGFTFMYWHQGDVVCAACDETFFKLWAASLVFAFSVILVVRWRKERRMMPLRWIGALSLFWLLFSGMAVVVSQ